MPLSPATRQNIEHCAESVMHMGGAIDPILGQEFSLLHTRLGAAIKRDGNLLCAVLIEALLNCPHLKVWVRPRMRVSAEADILSASGIDASEGVNLPYRADIGRVLCPDLVALDRRTGAVGVYEVKRGNARSDAGKVRSTIRDLLSMRMHVTGWVGAEGFRPNLALSKLIFVYGSNEIHRIDRRLALFRDDLDEHFSAPISADLEEAREHFRAMLLERRHDLFAPVA